MPPIIQVEHVSKQYRLGEVGTGTLSHDLKRWWYRARGKEDPYARIGEVNDRSTKGSSDYVWALQDINFSVAPGEVLGIIGRNGAGKSTLLKLLSKTTAPTTGKIKVRGRIASLLEVGTGFHPELTGRENIYLNGAILGMTRKEISHKFDEIVDFAGVERYVDTPVKRYSSGMYVRLAFAVAAHLEPEILIVDEVLAVGDAEFQKKCLGKMKDVSVNDGRTVLFVSHNMAAVSQLCTKCLLLYNGKIDLFGDVEVVISKYQKLNSFSKFESYISKANNSYIQKIFTTTDNNIFNHSEQVIIHFALAQFMINSSMYLGVSFFDQWKRKLFTTQYKLSDNTDEERNVILRTPANIFLSGTYSIEVAVFIPNGAVFEYLKDILDFQIIDYNSELAIYNGSDIGSLKIDCQWD